MEAGSHGKNGVLTRPEQPSDRAAVRRVHLSAFSSSAEADLVDALRRQAHPLVSLVAEQDKTVMGHILFSPVRLSGRSALKIMGLAPMAVLPSHQGQGAGSALVRAGLEQCKRLGFGAVVVLGHPGYYPRFGFSSARRLGLTCEYEAPEDAFMVLELEPGFFRGASGVIQYHPAFRNV